MKLLTNFFSSAATRFPVITIIVITGNLVAADEKKLVSNFMFES